MYINNNVEKWLFGFPKVKWLHLTAEVDQSVRFHIKFSPDLIYRKLLKSISFCQSYSKNKTVDVFLGVHGYNGSQNSRHACTTTKLQLQDRRTISELTLTGKMELQPMIVFYLSSCWTSMSSSVNRSLHHSEPILNPTNLLTLRVLL